MMKLKISPQAINDIKEIKSYIRNALENPAAADRIASKIVKAYKSLKDSPYIGTPLDAKLNLITDYRVLISGMYLIFYRIEDDTVYIVRIIDGRRDYCRLLFGISMNDVLIEPDSE